MNETVKIDGKEYEAISVSVLDEGVWHNPWWSKDGPSTEEEAQKVVDKLPPRSYYRRRGEIYLIYHFSHDKYQIEFCSDRVLELFHLRPGNTFSFEWREWKLVECFVDGVTVSGDYISINAGATVFA